MAEVIRCSDVTKVYRKGAVPVRALAGVSFSIEAGEMVTIMGPSGAGKSTLMHILGCLDTPTSGSFHLDGEEVTRKSDSEMAFIRNAKIGFVFQSFHLLPRTTALDNVLLPLAYRRSYPPDARARGLEALGAVGLAGRADHTPAELSGGEQQRVAIVRSLILEPRLILADEPTGDLDPQTGDDVQNLLFHLNEEKGVALVVATHSWQLARRIGRQMELREGRFFFL